MDFDDFAIEFLVVGGGFVQFFWEFEVPSFLFCDVFSDSELRFEWDEEIAVLFDDLFDVSGEFIVRVDLLFD